MHDKIADGLTERKGANLHGTGYEEGKGSTGERVIDIGRARRDKDAALLKGTPFGLGE